MFSKRQSAAAATTITVIAAGAVIEGTLRVQGTVQVDGTIDGMLVADGHVSIGPEGAVHGELEAESLSVAGTVEGNVMVRGHLRVLANGRVEGEARYATLEVERGGVMDGRTSVLQQDGGADNANGGAQVREIDAAE